MLVAYILALALGILFKMMHWPFASHILLFSILLPTIDVLVQLIRKSEIKGGRTLVSLSVAGFSFFILFKLKYWPGDIIMFLFAIALTIPFIIWCFVQGIRKMTGLRISIWILCFGFSIWLVSMSRLETRLTFLRENPENASDKIPPHIRYEIAFLYNQQQDYDKAENILKIVIAEQENYLLTDDRGREHPMKKMAERNLKRLRPNLESLQHHEWVAFESIQEYY